MTADIFGVVAAFYIAAIVVSSESPSAVLAPSRETALLLVSLPIWAFLFKLNGLYDGQEEQAGYSSPEAIFGVIQAVTLGTWALVVIWLVTSPDSPPLDRLGIFWLVAILLIPGGRAVARTACRRHPNFAQRVVVVGEGDIGQLVARKIRQHPEYGLDLLGFVDGDPKGRREDVAGLETLGELDHLHSIVNRLQVDRIIVAFSRKPDTATMEVIRSLRDAEVTVDVVPRLFELVGPRARVHTLEGLALLCLPSAELPRSSLLIKRLFDIVGASIVLALTLPLFAYCAYRIKRDSAGPVFFRQTRLGIGKKPFTVFKFRSMHVGTDEAEHQNYIRSIKDSSAAVGANGFYKLDRSGSVTAFGAWLRKTSLDELPQFINVLRGDMSIVGPRPCIPYETENFEPYQNDRFLVPQGITGLWQVTARANTTFGEALDMDVAYVHGWSLGLDLRLVVRTPGALLRQRKATA